MHELDRPVLTPPLAQPTVPLPQPEDDPSKHDEVRSEESKEASEIFDRVSKHLVHGVGEMIVVVILKREASVTAPTQHNYGYGILDEEGVIHFDVIRRPQPSTPTGQLAHTAEYYGWEQEP